MHRIALGFMPALMMGFLLGFEATAGAQDPYASAASPGDSTMAEHLRRARRARDARRWVEAEAGFRAALNAANTEMTTAAQRAAITGELGLCEIAMNKHRDAAEHLAESLTFRMALSPALRKRVEAGQLKADEHVVRLFLGVEPRDAELLVDGRPLGRLAPTYELFLEPGHHTVRARLPGYIDSLQAFDADAGKVHTVAMVLPRAAEPVARVKEEKAVVLAPAARLQAPGPWASWPGTLRAAGVVFTTGAVSVGALFMIRASVLDADIDERIHGLDGQPGWTSGSCRIVPQPDGCSELHRLRLDRDAFGRMGTGLVVAGGVVGAVTAASFFTNFSFLRGKPVHEGFTVAPGTTAHPIGLTARGAW